MVKRPSFFLATCFLFAGLLGEALAQSVPAPPAQGVEPGLEEAVKWKWKAVPSDEKAWGLELPEPPPPAPGGGIVQSTVPRDSTGSYEVKKGDALVLIGKKTGVTVAQLKAANGLTSDMIRIGQILKIPTPEECIALGLPPEPVKPKTAPHGPGKGNTKPSVAEAQIDQEVFLLQVFLDRENFSAGPIDGKTSLPFQKLVYLYQSNHGEVGDTATLKAKALAEVGELVARYTLKREDFRFIAPPKAETPSTTKPPTGAGKAKSAPQPPSVPPLSYKELTGSTMLAYRSPWQFVAERFHCSEDLLRLLNPGLAALPPAGTEFRVPNVLPFEIENAFDPPLQPASDPQKVITAAVVDLNRFEIYRNDVLIAVMPVSPARPGLRGKGAWTILDAIPRPRLATLQEPREVSKPATSNFFTGENATQVATGPVLTTEEYLPAGPKNPVGILWLNLAKSDSPDPLPYGLHGTSIPSEMARPGLGGFRLTNWDISRAVRLLPKGTPLLWKQTSTAAPQAAKPAL